MKKIMIVDDVDISNFIMKKMISKVPGDFDVHDFTFPSSAIENLQAINPDIIFLDVNMPVINGWQFLEIMKEKNYKYDVYVLTSSTSQTDVERAKDFDNVKDFLVKPIKLQALSEILEKCKHSLSFSLNH